MDFNRVACLRVYAYIINVATNAIYEKPPEKTMTEPVRLQTADIFRIVYIPLNLYFTDNEHTMADPDPRWASYYSASSVNLALKRAEKFHPSHPPKVIPTIDPNSPHAIEALLYYYQNPGERPADFIFNQPRRRTAIEAYLAFRDDPKKTLDSLYNLRMAMDPQFDFDPDFEDQDELHDTMITQPAWASYLA